ncbi:MAG: hypothetical protein JWO35_405 [Candidatus Saccharibacteria bacterium]|nr:hypothetical protein [Candidatus Saccharibacteria bacterium]
MKNPNSLNTNRYGKEIAAAASMASLALLGTAATAGAYDTKNLKPIIKAEKKLEHKIEGGQRVSFDANYDAYWSRPDYKGTLLQFVTHTPLTAEVNGETRLFRIIFKRPVRGSDDTNVDVDIRAIPKDAIKAQSPLTYGQPTPETPFPTLPVETKSAVLMPDYPNRTLDAEVERSDGATFLIPVGKTEPYGRKGVII